MKSINNIFRLLRSSPIARANQILTYKRFLLWQIGARILKKPVIMPWVNNTKLIISKGMTGATSNFYIGFMEYEEMLFLLHFLREDDVFGDIGANIGAYTILASSAVNCRSIAVEPIPSTMEHLLDNIYINRVNDIVTTLQIGVASMPGLLRFTEDNDTTNRVLPEEDDKPGICIKVDTIDNIFAESCPALLKIDIEGYEFQAIRGAEKILSNQLLKAIIIETNGSGAFYGNNDYDIHSGISEYGFEPYGYDPNSRNLFRLPAARSGNTIYIRDYNYVSARTVSSQKFKIFDASI
jgi:FkbM family methyltransferase